MVLTHLHKLLPKLAKRAIGWLTTWVTEVPPLVTHSVMVHPQGDRMSHNGFPMDGALGGCQLVATPERQQGHGDSIVYKKSQDSKL